ncbi:hypothetical protein L873DRAFT_1794306 [Choiromyces venosus 120613-1]|uniref:Uncharacterized protein n=1 Tax=Choiromyces venosus 120613-1 TaxID=1336337 RepID=A0A3N4J227_9PEZI|nr:hypothetical protein L873DRAFT_1794306 [Choiromyces venosus 120613-1]
MNPGIMPKVTKTLWDYEIVSDRIKQTLHQLKTSQAIMDSSMGGPVTMPLPQTMEFDVTNIYNYITRILQQFDTQDAYGIFASVHQGEGPIVPTFIFGLPQSNMKEISLPETPNNWPIWVYKDCILSANEFDTVWTQDIVTDVKELMLGGCLIGIESLQHLPFNDQYNYA